MRTIFADGILRRRKGGKGDGIKGRTKRGRAGSAVVFAGASNQISLMKWIYGIQPDEPEATDILSCAS